MIKQPLETLQTALSNADVVLIGAGAGLSAAAGFTYSGDRFTQHFQDFHEKYSVTDMYSAGFYPFATAEERWAYWSRHVYYNRYQDAPLPVYENLLSLVKDKDYFVLTTNVDHCFQKAGIDKSRLFYTQGDYGLFQCSEPCHKITYDNEAMVRTMLQEQKDMRIPMELVPVCPICSKPMTMNLRADAQFVEDDGWHQAAERYDAFIKKARSQRILYWELGVGFNTPGIIKYPFWQATHKNPLATYCCMNQKEAFCPPEIAKQSICIDRDIAQVLTQMHR